MLIKIGFDIEFELAGPTPMILMLYVHPSRQSDLRSEEKILVEPDIPLTDFTDLYGNRCARILAPAGNLRLSLNALIEDSGKPDEQRPDAPQHKVEDLPNDTLPFLLTSRYCEVDKLSDIAWKLFGSDRAWLAARSGPFCDWVHNHITFGYHFADPSKSAFDVYNDPRGVCRDFSHLAVAFCRCMNIPARYVSGYMGDIGVPSGSANGFQRLARSLSGRPLVHVRCATQCCAHRPHRHGGRPRRRRCGAHDKFRPRHPQEILHHQRRSVA